MDLIHWFGVKNDLRGQSNDSLRVCNIKIRTFLLGIFQRREGKGIFSKNVIPPRCEQTN